MYTLKLFYIFLLAFLIPLSVHAASITVVPPDHRVGVGEVFYVDVILDTEGSSINGIDAMITTTSSTLSLVRVEDGSSVIPLWIESPHIEGSTVTMSGIIPNGFSGLIDPFDFNNKKPGKIVRLVFTAVDIGNAAISTHATLTENDGNGTIVPTADTGISFSIAPTSSQPTYNSVDTIPPLLIASRTRDISLFDNKYTLIFSAQDKGSGVASVEVQEKNMKWNKVLSPYLLEDQSPQSTIHVRATDYAGNVTTVTIGEEGKEKTFTQFLLLALILLVVVPLIIWLYKKYVYKKQ